MTTRRFANNFHRKTQPANGEACTLKDHYNGVMRELVGYLDSLAAQDPTGERFVYAKPETIFKHCKKFAGMGYGKRVLWYALAEARERRIISNQVVRERWVGSGKKGQKVLRKLKGCIVAPHDCVAHMEGDVCVFHGPMKCGRWDRLFSTEPAKQVESEIFFVYDNTPSGVLYWAGCTQHAQPVQPACSASAVLVQRQCSACAVADSGQLSDLSEVKPKNGGLSRLSREAEQAGRTGPAVPAEEVAAHESKNGQAGRPGRAGNSSPSKTQTPTAWLVFTKAAYGLLPDEMLYASPKPGEHERVLAQLAALDGKVEDLCDEINEWADAQSPPLSTLHFGRWTRWLEQGQPRIDYLVEDAARRKRLLKNGGLK
jgi:hypothetical protein